MYTYIYGKLPLLANDIYVRCLCCPISRPTAPFRGLFFRVKTPSRLRDSVRERVEFVERAIMSLLTLKHGQHSVTF